MMYGWNYQGMGGGAWALMIVGMLVFWTILAVGLVALLRHNRSGYDGVDSPRSGNAAISILKERFARGELTEEEYSRRLAILKNQS